MPDETTHSPITENLAYQQAQEMGKLVGIVNGIKESMAEFQRAQREDRENLKQSITELRNGQERNRDGISRTLENIYTEIKGMNDTSRKQDAAVLLLTEFKSNCEKTLETANRRIAQVSNRVFTLEKARERQIGWMLGASFVGGGAAAILIFLVRAWLKI